MTVRILVIDDLFGRNLPDGRNLERENLCSNLLLVDGTDDEAARASQRKVIAPVAEALFYRGQSPAVSRVGSSVENNLDESLATVREGWAEPLVEGRPPWAIVLLDLCFYTGRVTEASDRRTPGMPEGKAADDDPRSYFGLSLLDAIHREFPELPVFILSSKPREDVSLEFSRRGALGFIDRSDMRAPELLQEAIWQHGILPDPSGEVIGNSLPLLLALREARRAARHRENLLIRGERGTGKELMARYLHRMSEQILDANRQECASSRPFVTVNSAVFSPNLFASELFGIEARTATGVDGKLGLLDMAHGGDVFLDEIADMPPEVQAAMLRVLQDRQFTKVGARETKEVDVRFLSATNANLESIPRGFRPDLLDRLRLGGTVVLPPLCERPTDIPLLADAFVRQAEARGKGALRRHIAREALDALRAHDWPGNIRELRTVVFDAVNRHPDVEHLVDEHLRIESGPRRGGAQSAQPRILSREAAADGAGLSDQSPGNDAESAIGGEQTAKSSTSFANLLATIQEFSFELEAANVWSGRHEEIRAACSRLLASHLEASLELTKRRTPETPDGVIQIHPAVKLMTGDAKMTASQAADLIKRLLGPIESGLSGILRNAYDTAIRLRPRSSPASNRRK